MKTSYKRGFTLIELLVVIAIIGLLAAVVLAAVGSARSKGADAAVKSQLSSMRAAAELYASNNGNSYIGGANICGASQAAGGFLTSLASAAAPTGSSVGVMAALETTTTTYCNADATRWVVQAPMTGGVYWCVDSTGTSKQEAAVALANAFACI